MEGASSAAVLNALASVHVYLSRRVRRLPIQATYPLDTLRLRLAVDPAARSVRGAARALMREGSHGAFFRGLGASMLGARAGPAAQPWKGFTSCASSSQEAFLFRCLWNNCMYCAAHGRHGALTCLSALHLTALSGAHEWSPVALQCVCRRRQMAAAA